MNWGLLTRTWHAKLADNFSKSRKWGRSNASITLNHDMQAGLSRKAGMLLANDPPTVGGEKLD